MIGKPSSQAVDSQVICSVGEDVKGLMNSNLQGDKAGDRTTSMNSDHLTFDKLRKEIDYVECPVCSGERVAEVCPLHLLYIKIIGKKYSEQLAETP
ncbi:hypothetical protein Tco_1181860 [Tanacetum coccineum]